MKGAVCVSRLNGATLPTAAPPGTQGYADVLDTLKYDWTKDVVEEAEQKGKQDSSENYGNGMVEPTA